MKTLSRIVMALPAAAAILYAVIASLFLSSCIGIKEHTANLHKARQHNVCRKFANPVNHYRQVIALRKVN